MNKEVKFLTQAALIAAIYAALTVALAPFSYGVMQVRVSEALTILPIFTPAAIPGLFVGCIVANIVGGYGPLDILLGSGATLIAAVLSYLLRKRPILVPLPPVLLNAIIIGPMLYYVVCQKSIALWICIGGVALGELISCYGLGYPLIKYLKKYEHIFKL